MPPIRYLILGDGAAGLMAAQQLRSLDTDGIIEIISDDPNPGYFRAALTNYIIGELRDDQVWAVPPDFFDIFNIRRTHARVVSLDAAADRVRLANGESLSFDRLLIATGARPRMLDVPGTNRTGVTALRTLQDARRVLDSIRGNTVRRALIVGSGPLALEWAQGFDQHGVPVTLVMRGDHLMRRELDAVASDLVEARLRMRGAQLIINDEVAEIFGDPAGRVGAVRLRSGATVECDFVGIAVGVLPITDFLHGSGVELSEAAAVLVDERQRTNRPGVYAAGDVAQVGSTGLQLWEPSRMQGRTAAVNMAGGDARTDLSAYYFATRLYDLDFALVRSTGTDPDRTIVDFPKGTGCISYRKLGFKDGRLVSALMLGEREARVRSRGRLLQRLIRERIEVDADADRLLSDDFDLGAWLQSRRRTRPLAPEPGATAPAELRRARAGDSMIAGAAPVPTATSEETIGVIGLKATHAVAVPGLEHVTAQAMLLGPSSERWELAEAVTLIGCDPKAGVPLGGPGISFAHADISRVKGAHYIRDLGSAAGTRVNGQPASVPVRLRSGDRIEIGAMLLTYHTDFDESGRLSTRAFGS